ncbi:S66 peptidase family protein [Metamycoplasma spumans]|uniref:S66 family peptidase n=1 Tax=Metamycoplasma spumans TaxID=92406 RepID=UPI0034DD846B
MIKTLKKLKHNDQIGIISLSSGLLGEKSCQHQVQLGIKRIKEMNLNPVFSKHCLSGLEYIDKNPDKRAEDLIELSNNDNIKAIVCAIGGFDTYRTLPYILDSKINLEILRDNPKIFLGYSDTTINHLMFNKLGLSSFYGLAFITDLAELDRNMLPYHATAFNFMFKGKKKTYRPSKYWYEERKDFSSKQINIPRPKHKEQYGYISIQGSKAFEGILVGGCLDSIDRICNPENVEEYSINQKYDLFTNKTNFKNKILLLETSEEKPTPKEINKMLKNLETTNCFSKLRAVIIGKPQDEAYLLEYIDVFKNFFKKYPNLSVVYNINIGHSYPKMMLALNNKIKVNINKQKITTYWPKLK